MALFSRKKSKAKKASKEEEKKKAADAASSTSPARTPQRGRNGKIIPLTQTSTEDEVPDIPAPSQLPRHYNSLHERPLVSGRGRSYSFEDHYQAEGSKHGYFDPQSPGDSGYASAGSGSRMHSRAHSTRQAQRGPDYFQSSNKSMPHLTLGEELAQEPAFAEHRFEFDDEDDGRHYQSDGGNTLKPSKSMQAMRKQAESDQIGPLRTTQHQQYSYQDGRQQRMIQQNMPMRPSSVPAHASQPRYERMSHPSLQRSISPGPVMQSNHPALLPRSRTSAPVNKGPSRELGARVLSDRGHQLKSSQSGPQSPTSPVSHNDDRDLAQDEFLPSLNILNGLKVNKRGLILDEEGDPIGELYDGDIIDCVRQKADAYGDVLDEYGRVVGKVRTLSAQSTGSRLRRSSTISNNADQRRRTSPPPPVPALRSVVEPPKANEGRHIASQDFVQKELSPLSTKEAPTPHHRDHINDDVYGTMGPYDIQDAELLHTDGSHAAGQIGEHSAPQYMDCETAMHRSESLPSVPESHSTIEIPLSDDDYSESEEGRRPKAEPEPEHMQQINADSEQVIARPGSARSVKEATVQQPQILVNTDLSAVTGAVVTSHEHPIANTQQPEQIANMPPVHSRSRSVSERAIPTAGLPPVPAVPKNFLDLKKPAQAQPFGFPPANPTRARAPLPAFPSRALSAGIAGNGLNGPMPGLAPGLPTRRLTTPAFLPMAGIASLGAQSPLHKPRTSMPLVRSPLSSHETTPAESDRGSAQGEARTAGGHSRSQSLKTVNTTHSTAVGAGKPRKVFAHAGQAAPSKSADIVVKEVGEERKSAEKKKGMKGLFGRKK